jgi:hypothetical protein
MESTDSRSTPVQPLFAKARSLVGYLGVLVHGFFMGGID